MSGKATFIERGEKCLLGAWWGRKGVERNEEELLKSMGFLYVDTKMF